jgi:hypothetical protein
MAEGRAHQTGTPRHTGDDSSADFANRQTARACTNMRWGLVVPPVAQCLLLVQNAMRKSCSLVQVSGGAGSVTIAPYSVLVLSRAALPSLDSDGDGLLNGWEQAHFGDPLSGVATADNDLDGANNLQEQAADTDPNSADSVLRFTGIQATGGNISLKWKGGQSVRQVIQQRDGLEGTWNPVYTNPPPTAVSNTITLPASFSRFFRSQVGS